MTIYKITQKYWDDGEVKAFMTELESDIKPTDIYLKKKHYDYYETFLESKKEAKQFLKECHSFKLKEVLLDT